jgi:hypothetical protein
MDQTQTFTANDVKLLKKHLQAIVEVEFFTVPFYLTAVYSFTSAALNYSPDGGKTHPLYDLQQQTLSVAVQEMYHLQLACNLANAFDVKPEIPPLTLPAGQVIKIPHLEEKSQPLTSQLGNLPAVIAAMVAVETPDPGHTFPPPNSAVVYPSISDLYHATLTLLNKYYLAFNLKALEQDPHFIPNNKQVAYVGFNTDYRHNAIASRTDVIQAANAITDQGEGNLLAKEIGGPFRSGENDNVLPEYQPTPDNRFFKYDGVTHFKRFEDIQTALKAWSKFDQVFYEANGKLSLDLPPWAEQLGYEKLQQDLNLIWSYLVDTLQSGFQDGQLQQPNYPDISVPGFNEAMLTFKYLLPLLWQWGQCPSFVYQAGVTPLQLQPILDEVDPLCLFHWDQQTRDLRTQEQKAGQAFNACQGLNECAGKGWGGIATQKGDGACATADFHTCGGGNSCKYQGGCGFQTNPGENSASGNGGCQTPIATQQVFAKDATPPPLPPERNVWKQARTLFQERERLAKLPDPLSKSVKQADGAIINYDGNARREAIQATSK